jgi:viroplasmin and RNaseH domain-containing protein
MKKTISMLLFVFFYSSTSYAAFKEYVLNFKNVAADILTAKELNIVFFHIADNVSIEKSSQKFVLKFKTASKDIQSNIQFLINGKYFVEVALKDAKAKMKFDFKNRSIHDKDSISVYKELLKNNEIKSTKIYLSFLK